MGKIKMVSNGIRECGIFCFYFLSLILVGCNSDSSSTEGFADEAERITNSQAWGEKRDALSRNEAIGDTAELVDAVLPEGEPAPELFESTRRVYSYIQASRQASDFSDYREQIPAAGFTGIDMVAIPAGEFTMGSPDHEAHRKDDEGPAHQVYVDAFWISKIEVPWEVYTSFMENGMPRSKDGELLEKREDHEAWDAVAQPTVPYVPMNLGMGAGYQEGFPAIAMSHYAACKFCEWLSAQTGRYYRLPTEAEWEYACRAGSQTAFSYGDDEERLSEYAWFWNNSHDQYQRTGTKKPNLFQLNDMHGNVAEWVLDSYDAKAYQDRPGKKIRNPLVLLPDNRGHVVRGGSWEDDPDALRSAARRRSSPNWNMQDPQNPKSIWYLTDGGMIGFRIVRPVKVPDVVTMHRLWNLSKGQY